MVIHTCMAHRCIVNLFIIHDNQLCEDIMVALCLSPNFPIVDTSSHTLKHLRASAQQYFNQGISAATRNAYTTGLKKYSTFCSQTKLQPVPATEDTLVLFITHVAQQNLSYGTIQVYLLAVRYNHITN